MFHVDQACNMSPQVLRPEEGQSCASLPSRIVQHSNRSSVASAPEPSASWMPDLLKMSRVSANSTDSGWTFSSHTRGRAARRRHRNLALPDITWHIMLSKISAKYENICEIESRNKFLYTAFQRRKIWVN